MLAKVRSGALCGIDAYSVEVEVDISSGLPAFTTVGLPDAAVKESRERVESAIRNCGFRFPRRRITVNLAPADRKKAGSALDVPIALGILVTEGIIQQERVNDFLFSGELSLDGTICPVKGVLPLTVMARSEQCTGIVVPAQNRLEAAVVEGIQAYPAHNLPQVVEFLNGELAIEPATREETEIPKDARADALDLRDIRGQAHAKRALEVAAAGSHNLLMIGPPGAGKTMLAKRLPSILPTMRLEEAIETTKIHSVLGLLGEQTGLVSERPFRAPHHTISNAGLIGGGSIPKPGEVSLAHNGVLFLDELPEFKRDVLEVLRQPLEDGSVTIARVTSTVTYPASFTLAAAMNPCRCGYYGDERRECICTPLQIQHYLSKISGPLLDRIDIHIDVPSVPYRELVQKGRGSGSKAVRSRITKARRIQWNRLLGRGVHTNAQLNVKMTRAFCSPDRAGHSLLETAIEKLGLSARAYDRILKVARTIADLEDEESVRAQHISEAIQYRTLDRAFWRDGMVVETLPHRL